MNPYATSYLSSSVLRPPVNYGGFTKTGMWSNWPKTGTDKAAFNSTNRNIGYNKG